MFYLGYFCLTNNRLIINFLVTKVLLHMSWFIRFFARKMKDVIEVAHVHSSARILWFYWGHRVDESSCEG